jgi:hypothetical protein
MYVFEDIRELGNTAQKYGGKYGELYSRITVCTANPRRQVGAPEQCLDKFKTHRILSRIKKYFVTINMSYVLPAVKHNLTFVRSQSIYARFMVSVDVTSGFGEFVVV